MRVLFVGNRPHCEEASGACPAVAPCIEFAAVAAYGVDVADKVREFMPDLVLIGFPVPAPDGPEIVRRIKAALAYVRIVILARSEDDPALFDAVKNGAEGYVMAADAAPVARLLDRLALGVVPVRPRLAARLLRSVDLSPRERQVLERIAAEENDVAIAAARSTADRSAVNHARNVIAKLHRGAERVDAD